MRYGVSEAPLLYSLVGLYNSLGIPEGRPSRLQSGFMTIPNFFIIIEVDLPVKTELQRTFKQSTQHIGFDCQTWGLFKSGTGIYLGANNIEWIHSKHLNMTDLPFEVPFPPKTAIKCVYSSQYEDHEQVTPTLIFTHGAGGTLKADAVVNFSNGFASYSEVGIVCFQGNMNLSSRVKMFNAVMNHLNFPNCLGGRSMGARAAVMAATDETTHLVLVSYPLHTDKDLRDQILLELPPSVKVIFISGTKDAMCELDRLEQVRSRMKCKTWRVVVQEADHGMNLSPKSGTKDVGRKTGEVVAHWLGNADEVKREGKIEWDRDAAIAQWSGWLTETSDARGDHVAHSNHVGGPSHQSKRKVEGNGLGPATRKRRT